jgi:hypothetical protein
VWRPLRNFQDFLDFPEVRGDFRLLLVGKHKFPGILGIRTGPGPILGPKNWPRKFKIKKF